VEQGGLTPADIIPVAPTLCGCVALSRHRALVGGQRLVNQNPGVDKGLGTTCGAGIDHPRGD
jgi:hypothetical protein